MVTHNNTPIPYYVSELGLIGWRLGLVSQVIVSNYY